MKPEEYLQHVRDLVRSGDAQGLLDFDRKESAQVWPLLSHQQQVNVGSKLRWASIVVKCYALEAERRGTAVPLRKDEVG